MEPIRQKHWDPLQMGLWLGRLALWLLVGALVLYPLGMVFVSTVFAGSFGEPPFQMGDLLTPRIVSAWRNTLLLGFWVTLLSTAWAAPLALLALGSPWARWLDGLMSIPFLTPPFLVSLAWTLAVGRRGYLSGWGLPGSAAEGILFSVGGLALLMSLNYTPMVYFALRAQSSGVAGSLLWAGQVAGGCRRSVLWRILLPLVLPGFWAGGFLAFASCISEYGTPLVIGNRIGFPVVATEIARLINVSPINLTLASAMGSLLLITGASFYCLSRLLQQPSPLTSSRSHYPPPILLAAWARVGCWGLAALYALLAVILPYSSIGTTSLLRLLSRGPAWDNLTLEHYATLLQVGSRGFSALTTSLGLALLAATLGTLVGLLAVRVSPWMATVATIPVAIPAITTAVGFIRAWNAPWAHGIPLYGTALLVGLYYTAQYLPYAVQYAQAGNAGLPISYARAARLHGAGASTTFFRILLPLLWPHSLAGALLIFSIAFRELVGSSLLRPPGLQTTSTFILGQFDQGSASAGMAMGVMAVLLAWISVVSVRRVGLKQTLVE
ncbi:MAG: ABC transporter permease subunit [Thermostichus sp. DG02_5_bins_236]